eukprot:GHVU01194195.1.p1 GENE.GHVU01194195.1~~GHVU01194195.1.p1  ORF type:complete len:219 (+),score=11.65 GHVU01194195.1:108-764(+)
MRSFAILFLPSLMNVAVALRIYPVQRTQLHVNDSHSMLQTTCRAAADAPSQMEYVGPSQMHNDSPTPSSMISTSETSGPDTYSQNAPLVGMPCTQMSQHQEFEIEQYDSISERGINIYRYRHRGTGARVLLVEGDDENPERVFMASFNTPVFDSKGAPNVLENALLRGSYRRPGVDALLDLGRGALVTFLDASLYPDRTEYSFGSLNNKVGRSHIRSS